MLSLPPRLHKTVHLILAAQMILQQFLLALPPDLTLDLGFLNPLAASDASGPDLSSPPEAQNSGPLTVTVPAPLKPPPRQPDVNQIRQNIPLLFVENRGQVVAPKSLPSNARPHFQVQGAEHGRPTPSS